MNADRKVPASPFLVCFFYQCCRGVTANAPFPLMLLAAPRRDDGWSCVRTAQLLTIPAGLFHSAFRATARAATSGLRAQKSCRAFRSAQLAKHPARFQQSGVPAQLPAQDKKYRE